MERHLADATRALVTGTSFGDNVLAVLPEVAGATIGNIVTQGIAGIPRETSMARNRRNGVVEIARNVDPDVLSDGPTLSEIVVIGRRLRDRAAAGGQGILDWIDSWTGFNLGGHNPHTETATRRISMTVREAAMSIGEAVSRYNVVTRAMGLAQAFGGAWEAGAGSTLVVAGTGVGTTGVGLPIGIPATAAGVVFVAHGSDNIATGLRTAWTGQPQETATSRALQFVGASPATAVSVDAGINMASGVGAVVAFRSAAPVMRTGVGYLPNLPGTIAAESEALSPFTQRYLTESGGRFGGTATRQQNYAISRELEARGYSFPERPGGGLGPEEYIPGSGSNGGTYVDITGIAPNGRTVRIQTITTRADGVTPTASEAAAAARIRAAFPNDKLVLVPKRKP